LVSGGLPLWRRVGIKMGQKKNLKVPVGARDSRTSVLKFPIVFLGMGARARLH